MSSNLTISDRLRHILYNWISLRLKFVIHINGCFRKAITGYLHNFLDVTLCYYVPSTVLHWRPTALPNGQKSCMNFELLSQFVWTTHPWSVNYQKVTWKLWSKMTVTGNWEDWVLSYHSYPTTFAINLLNISWIPGFTDVFAFSA